MYNLAGKACPERSRRVAGATNDYGQRLAVSSHPAARTGCAADTTGGAGMRIGCCGPFTAMAGFTMSEFISFSSDS
jgi:hypothetical protein